ncbi:MAG TPA: hypothetical protein VF101_04745 [Gaiellaceae bacterium]
MVSPRKSLAALGGFALAAGAAAAAGHLGGAAARPAACVPTKVLRTNPPLWTRGARVPAGTPFVVGSGSRVAGFLFVPPHVSNPGRNPHNKILWVIGRPRRADSLSIVARHGSPRATVRVVRKPDSSSGAIYPSTIDFPYAGCWAVSLRWGSDSATLMLRVTATVRSWSQVGG